MYLQGIGGSFDGRKLPVEGELLIGRDASMCQLVYSGADKNISGVHCKVQDAGGHLLLTDMGSTNGTFLDSGVRLSPYEPQSLEAGQCFYLGEKGNLFRVCAAEEGAERTPDTPERADRRVPENGRGKGLAIAAMTLGILAVLTGAVCLYLEKSALVVFVLAVPAIVMGMYVLCARAAGKWMALSGLICSVTVLAVLFAAAAVKKPESIIGTWRYADSDNVRMTKDVGDVLEEALSETEFSPQAHLLAESFGLDKSVSLSFTESGAIYVNTSDGLAFGSANLGWEEMGDHVLLIKMELPALSVAGISFPPINIAYQTAYEIKGDTLLLKDFFGEEIRLEKAE